MAIQDDRRGHSVLSQIGVMERIFFDRQQALMLVKGLQPLILSTLTPWSDKQSHLFERVPRPTPSPIERQMAICHHRSKILLQRVAVHAC